MKKLILDTNVWYDIAKGTLTPPSLKDYEVVSTWVIISEFSISGKLISNFEFVKDAIRTAMTNSDFAEHRNFPHYLLSFDNQSTSKYDDDYAVIVDFTTAIANNSQINKSVIQESVQKYWQKQEYSIVGINQNLAVLHSHFKKRFKKNAKKEICSSDFIPMSKNFIKSVVKASSGLDLSQKFDWDQFDLLLLTMNNFFKHKLIHRGKVQTRDLNDLFNLCYVQPDDLYYTGETQWHKRISQDTRTAKYLFTP